MADRQYFDIAFLTGILLVWAVEIYRRSTYVSNIAPKVREFFANAFEFKYPRGKSDSCHLQVRPECPMSLSVGNFCDLRNQPSIILTRSQIAMFIAFIITLMAQYSYVLSGKLDPKSLLWVLIFLPVAQFYQITFNTSGSIVLKGEENKTMQTMRYAFSTFFVVCGFVGGIIVVRLAMCDIRERNFYYLAWGFYFLHGFGSLVLALVSNESFTRDTGTIMKTICSSDVYMVFTRYEVAVHLVIYLITISVLLLGVASNTLQLIGIAPLVVLGSVTFALINTLIAFARSHKVGANWIGLVANIALSASLFYGLLAFHNSLCTFCSIPCHTTVRMFESGKIGFQAWSFWPVVLLSLVVSLGAQTSIGGLPHTMLRISGHSDSMEHMSVRSA